MKDKWKDVRTVLPEHMHKQFDDIVEQKVLGASKHIAMIGDMIEAIALEGRKENRKTTQVIADIKLVTDYFMATRGEASQAVNNAILLMIHGIELHSETEIAEAADKIIETKNNYLITSNEAIDKVVEYAVKLSKDMDRIFVYDYSSTVEKFLVKLGQTGKKYTIYIAESRVINGGKPFITPCQKAGHDIRYIPDAAIMYYLRSCDAAFMGAETFYPDGTGFNTTGSDLVGLVCTHFHIPLYFLTPMIKLDIRPIYGFKRELVINDLTEKMSADWDKEIDITKIDFRSPELVGVEANNIKGFVTEQGIIPADQMYQASLAYSEFLRA